MFDEIIGQACENCGMRPATTWWTEGTWAFVHGARQAWCDICVTSEHLNHAMKMAKKVPELKEKLAQLKRAEEAAAGEDG